MIDVRVAERCRRGSLSREGVHGVTRPDGRHPAGRDAAYWIDGLGLESHVEGGYFREVYRSRETIPAAALPARFGDARTISTAIYFLLESEQVSAFHRIKSDELWHFYYGSPLTLHIIDDRGQYVQRGLGDSPDVGECFQAVIPAGSWYGATVNAPDSYSLVGGTVAPGFDFADFELARRDELLGRYPEHRGIIERLTVRPAH